MQSPKKIGFLSIIPGLGFFQLGQIKRAFISFGIVLGSIIIAVFSVFTTYDFLCGPFIQISFIAWIAQIYFAVQTANALDKQLSGETSAMREIISPEPPPNLSLSERLIFKIYETVKQQINLGEHLTHAIIAQYMPTFGSHFWLGPFAFLKMRTYHIGLLAETSIIVIEHDFNGKPANVKRIELGKMKSSRYKKGLLMDKIFLDLGDEKLLPLRVSFRLRENTQAIYFALQSEGRANPALS